MTDAAAPSDGRDHSAALICTTLGGDHGQSARRTTTSTVAALLGNFRLLEAAGACEVIATTAIEPGHPSTPPAWWKAAADAARSYRSAIHDVIGRGFDAIDDWSKSGASADRELCQERARLRAEYRHWLCEVPGGGAYVTWLSAYVAAVELDGQRALASLERCTMLAQEFIEVPKLGPEVSVYEILQGTADALVLFLPLGEHPLRDMRRFAFVPAVLRTGYGS
jgi:hypothetical protein